MKKIFITLLFCTAAICSQAQIEIKLNPIAVVAKGFQAGVEFATSDRIGVDLDLFAAEGVVYFTAAGKYYFNTDRPITGFHIGLFTGGGGFDDETIGPGLGFLTGYKWLASSDKVSFELGLGAGRTFSSDTTDGFLPYFRLHVGYRFSKDIND